MSSQKITHVLWDWNGTLLDDREICVELLNSMLIPRGLKPIDLATYLEVFRFPIKDYYRLVGFDFTKESYESLAAQYMKIYPKAAECAGIAPGIPEALDTLRSAGIIQTIISASNTVMLRSQAAALGVDGYFDEILGLSDWLAHGKEAIAEDYMRRHGIRGEDTVFIGDSPHDCEVARQIGAEPLLLCGGHCSSARLRDTGAEVFDTPQALLSHLLGKI